MARFPRVRGDVPIILLPRHQLHPFSPRTRGCSVESDAITDETKVFPAYAGMFRLETGEAIPKSRFPRVRGDVPPQNCYVPTGFGFSPRTRGCSLAGTLWGSHRQVFPAYAGMFRRRKSRTGRPRSFPRVRGDVPAWKKPNSTLRKFSPRTRGCSFDCVLGFFPNQVFPAYAGMFLAQNPIRIPGPSFPRVRGDVPDLPQIVPEPTMVFPAYAGMFRSAWIGCIRIGSFPRVRGDVPAPAHLPGQYLPFSPRTRGCSAHYSG